MDIYVHTLLHNNHSVITIKKTRLSTLKCGDVGEAGGWEPTGKRRRRKLIEFFPTKGVFLKAL